VVNSDHGAALLKNSALACEIVRSVKENTNLPVSVKTRLGWQHDDQILEFAPLLWRAGIDAITIHGRTYKDSFKGKARWDNISKVKELVGDDLIVIGNGDIESIDDPRTKNLDGFAIGRAAFGKPWIFSGNDIDFSQLKEIILRHAKLTFEMKGEYGMLEFRKHLLAYLKGFSGAKALRNQAVAVGNVRDVSELVSSL
jgi:tRNA-dihydrouridine synthase